MPEVMRYAALTAVLLGTLNGGVKAQEGFGLGYSDVGVVVGLGGIGDASLSLGGRFEKAIKALPEMGNGTLGIMVSADWWHYTNDILGTNYGWTYFPISGTANYHFRVEGGKWDPFLGAGLGIWIVSVPNCPGCSGSSGVYLVGRAGVRYFLAPTMALYADVGAGAAALDVGATFKLSGPN